jgi:hypothetical protein
MALDLRTGSPFEAEVERAAHALSTLRYGLIQSACAWHSLEAVRLCEQNARNLAGRARGDWADIKQIHDSLTLRERSIDSILGLLDDTQLH